MELIWVIISATIFVIKRVSSTENVADLETNERFCSEGWHPFGELCYKSFLETMNFENAEKECVKLGGNLAAIHSSEIQGATYGYESWNLKEIEVFEMWCYRRKLCHSCLDRRTNEWVLKKLGRCRILLQRVEKRKLIFWTYINNFIKAKFLRELHHKPYIGLERNKSTTKFYWRDGTELDFSAWYPNEPNGQPTGWVEDCVEMVFSHILGFLGRWNDVSCDAERSFICQKLKDSKTEHPMNGSNQCSRTDNGIYYKNSCFYLISSVKTWEEAETHCVEQYNGHLASVTNTVVQTFLHYEMANDKHRSPGVWIGIRLKPDDIALWSSGWYVGFNNWNDKKTARKVSSTLCVSMMSSTGEWILDSCDRRLPFICENSSAIPPPRLNPTIPGLSCPSGENEWIDLGGDYCYIFHPETYVTWEEANFICMRKDGEFVWIDGSPVNYKNWISTEPNNDENLCVEARLHEDKGWIDITCARRNLFVCSVVKMGSVMRSLEEEKCDGFPAPVVVGVAVGVLVGVITVIGVMLFYLYCRMKAQQQLCKKCWRNSNHNTNADTTSQGSVYEEIYEPIYEPIYEHMNVDF